MKLLVADFKDRVLEPACAFFFGDQVEGRLANTIGGACCEPTVNDLVFSNGIPWRILALYGHFAECRRNMDIRVCVCAENGSWRWRGGLGI